MLNLKINLAFFLMFLMLCAFTVQDKQSLNIVFIGDSITHGARLKDYTVQAPPVFASGYLQKEASFGNIQFSNQGVSGATTSDFLPSSGKLFKNVTNAANIFYDDTRSVLVFNIMLGTNDSAIKGPRGAPAIASTYRNNLKTIIDSLLARYPKCKVIINHPIWYSPNTDNGHSSYMEEGLERLQSYFAEIDGLVNDYKELKPHHVFLGDTNGFKYFKKHHETDIGEEKGPHGTFYLHPNEKGAAALGQLWGKAIEKALK